MSVRRKSASVAREHLRDYVVRELREHRFTRARSAVGASRGRAELNSVSVARLVSLKGSLRDEGFETVPRYAREENAISPCRARARFPERVYPR